MYQSCQVRRVLARGASAGAAWEESLWSISSKSSVAAAGESSSRFFYEEFGGPTEWDEGGRGDGDQVGIAVYIQACNC